MWSDGYDRLRIGYRSFEYCNMGQSKILVVDDDPRICKLVARYLARENFSVATAGDAAEMWRIIEIEQLDLIILDLMLPDEDGLSLAQQLRNRSDLPIIMLTGKSDVVDRVVGLELGADDYITKPFDERELLARIRSVIRRSGARNGDAAESGRLARFAGWQLDLIAHQLNTPQGDTVHLTSHEFRLLSIFVTRPNQTLSRDQIVYLMSGRDWNPTDRTVDMLVVKLRKKIEQDASQPALIKTIRGEGYQFAAAVEREESAA